MTAPVDPPLMEPFVRPPVPAAKASADQRETEAGFYRRNIAHRARRKASLSRTLAATAPYLLVAFLLFCIWWISDYNHILLTGAP